DRAHHTLADAPGHVGELPAHHQNHHAGYALLTFRQHLAGADLGAALLRVHGVFAAGVLADGDGDGRAVALAEKGVHALRGGAGGVEDRQLDALADFATNVAGDALDALL